MNCFDSYADGKGDMAFDLILAPWGSFFDMKWPCINHSTTQETAMVVALVLSGADPLAAEMQQHGKHL
jgi:hypothetical protein